MKQKNVGIELLRSVSMLFVVMLHVLNAGGILDGADRNTYYAKIAYTLFIIAFCGVDCFALISGFVGWKSRLKLSRILLLWLQTFFYSVLITSIFSVVFPECVTVEVWKTSLLPITMNEYWYISAYFGFLFFAPFMNLGIQNIKRRQFEICLFCAFVLGTIMPWIAKSSPYGFNAGYSTIWLCVMYAAGAYVSKYELNKKFKNIYLLLICAVSGFVTFMSYRRQIDGLIEYTSPTIVICAVSLLMFCLNLSIKQESVMGKIIIFCGPSALSVFLIHVHPLVYSKVIAGSSAKYLQFNLLGFTLSIFAEVFVIFTVCIVIDILRRFLFKCAGIEKFAAMLDDKLNGFLKTEADL